MNPATEEIFARIIAIGLLLAVLYFMIWPLVRAIREKKSIGQKIVDRLIATGIIFILVVIAIPDFIKFSTSQHHRYIVENLRAIRVAQEKYHSEHGVYAGGPKTFMLLDWRPSSWRSHLFFWYDDRRPNHAFFCGDDYIRNPTGDAIPRSVRPAITGSSATGFTCTAVGRFEGTPKLDYWLVNERGNIIQNSPYDWARYPLSEQEAQELFSIDPSRIPKKFIDQDGRLQLRR